MLQAERIVKLSTHEPDAGNADVGIAYTYVGGTCAAGTSVFYAHRFGDHDGFCPNSGGIGGNASM